MGVVAFLLGVKGQSRVNHHLQGIPTRVGPYLPSQGD